MGVEIAVALRGRATKEPFSADEVAKLEAAYMSSAFAKYRNIPIPRAMKSVNVYFGLGFNFGKAGALKARDKKAENNGDLSWYGTL